MSEQVTQDYLNKCLNKVTNKLSVLIKALSVLKPWLKNINKKKELNIHKWMLKQ